MKWYIYSLLLIGLLIYSSAIANNFVADDYYQIVTNLQIQQVQNPLNFFFGSTYYNGGSKELVGVYYRPVMVTLYALLYWLFGPNPHMYHLVQILLHSINAILILLLLQRFFPLKLAYAFSLLFLIHPQNNETVVYIANLQDTFFFFFGLTGSLLFMRTKPHLIVSGLLFLLSLLSKETGVLFLLSSALALFLFYPNDKLKRYITLIIPLLFYLLLRFPIAHIGQTYHALSPIALAHFSDRFLTIPSIISFYLSTFFVPIHINALHFWVVRSYNWQTFFLPLLLDLSFFSFLSWMIFINWRKQKRLAKQLLFFFIWLTLGLLVHLQLLTSLDATAADRWFYFPFIGMLGILASCYQLYQMDRLTKPLRRSLLILFICLVIILSLNTYLRSADWKDTLTLYEHDIPYSDPNFLTSNALATEYIRLGEYEKAKPLVLSSIDSYPYFANFNNAAVISLSEGDITSTKRYLQRALATSQNYQLYVNYSNFLVKYGTREEALQFTQKSLRLFPDNAQLQKNYHELLRVKKC